MLDVIDYYEIDQMTDEQLYNEKKQYLDSNYYRISQLIHSNIHNFTSEILEYYKEQALERVEYDIQEMEFFKRHTNYTYAEVEYINYLNNHRDRLIELFDKFIYGEV